MKHPAVYIYKKTSDKGQELRYSMRSLQNVKNWNGEVFVAGDKEDWFSDKVQIIDNFTRSHVKWLDQQAKMRAIIDDSRVSDDFIYFNDDFFITEPTEITPLYDGKLENVNTRNGWVQAKSDSKLFLKELNISEPLNYDIHVPIVFNKQKLTKVLDMLDQNKQTRLQPRSIYGNYYHIGGKQYKDRKGRTRKLLEGELLSTRVFSDELKTMFPDKSEFEK